MGLEWNVYLFSCMGVGNHIDLNWGCSVPLANNADRAEEFQ
jgi:hypothetical protein